MDSILKPNCFKRSIRISWQPASSGVSERRAISALASDNVLLGVLLGIESGLDEFNDFIFHILRGFKPRAALRHGAGADE